jgi:hypothetical protein
MIVNTIKTNKQIGISKISYNVVIKDQLEKGIFEKIGEDVIHGRVYYSAPHAVLTPQKSTSTLRVVYDSSAKTNTEKSLNKCIIEACDFFY